MRTAIIVDDEITARKRLKTLLKTHEDVIQVIDEAADGKEAVKKINELKPDIVFLDIQMPELSGIHLTEILEHRPYVVFVTAHHEYAIKAFEQNSLDFLLKPVEPERLELTIKRINELGAQSNMPLDLIHKMISQLQQNNKLDTIPVKVSNKIILIPVENIIYLEAREKYVFIHTSEEHHLIDQTLTYLEEKLPAIFVRINRTFIINKQKVKEIHKHLKGTFVFTMLDKKQSKLTSGNTYYEQIKKMLSV